MARLRTKGNTQSVPKNKGTRPRGIKKERAQFSPRTRTRLQRLQERTVSKATNAEPEHTLLSPTSNTPGKEFPQAEERKRKRSQEDEAPLPSTTTLPRKRPRTSHQGSYIEETISANTTVGISGKDINPLEYWSREGFWPKEYFKPESNMNHMLARKKSFHAKQSEAGSTNPSSAPSDERPREAKSIPYARPSYETVLAAKKSFMDKFNGGIQKASSDLCQTLLSSEQTYPQDSLFRDDLFDITCRKIRNRNEAMVIRDISPLIVPSAQTLATYGSTHLNHLIESVNEGWNSARPFYGPRPQPDYSVGFGRSAFTDDQLEKLEPFVGEVPDGFTSYFMATWQMYFPFLTCEVKCGNLALDIADRQNAHSMTLAVRGIVELFRMVKREKEVHLQILAFSVSHDHQTVRIYGHYPLIDGDKTEFYRHPIHYISFALGKEKWAAYTFTKNVYDIWMPTHLERIRSAIDALPPNLERSEPGESGLSQGLESHNLANQSSNDAASVPEEAGSSHVDSLDVTSDTSLSQGAFKKPRKRGWNMESRP